MRFKSKSYYKIPGGEIQYGNVTHCVTIWFGTHCLHLWRGNLRCWFGRHAWTLRFPEDTRFCPRCLKCE